MAGHHFFIFTALSLTPALGLAQVQTAPVQTAPAKTPPAEAADDDLINPDRPGIADGSTVIGKHHFQIETGLTYELRHPSSGSTWDLLTPTLLRVGVDEKWEFRFETNGFAYLSDHGTTAGYSPWSIGAKYHWQDSGGLSKPSLGLIGRVYPPSGSASFGTTIPTADLRLCMDWDIAPPKWSLNPNIGLATYQDPSGDRFTALLGAFTINYWPNSHLNPFLDMGYQSPEGKMGKQALIFDGGVAIITDKNTQLDFSAGFGTAGDSPARPFIAVGYSHRF